VTLLSLLSLGSRRAYHSDRRHPANDQVIFPASPNFPALPEGLHQDGERQCQELKDRVTSERL
jgi:hypothetical protein